ncbi:MAG: hypothetical protein HY712_00950 [candidate division NC10 bacterium]|nr:hypothetical protein [candidate division NC10 bacterium]
MGTTDTRGRGIADRYTAAPTRRREDLAVRGARILPQGHPPRAAPPPADLKPKVAAAQELDHLGDGATCKRWQRAFVREPRWGTYGERRGPRSRVGAPARG